ncbi:hypothetical protein HELRODRAFT_169042 [Helobdella robusta]|uniref:Ephrin RBD domain-containing protein n=1 Tax=Helobdella robusta TaxID=6412 RepID=T1F1A9_HELRO|nr:hypothetical protein HELRODRAFT_169042 [Helobdella robusta]ESO09102.1 hypothetical protein HELRODRAFT_169042 [Helobdella robusta]
MPTLYVRFKKSTNLPSVEIMMGDYIEIICPIYSNTTDASVMEVYVLRWVSEEEYRGCYVKNPNSKIFQCDTPLKRNKFTLAILPNPSVPGQMTFKEDTRYYMTSTSTGRSEGLLNKEGGVCAERNMKLIFYVPKLHFNIASSAVSIDGKEDNSA